MRKNVLSVLTHLILNDMVKVKGQVSELALCLVDAEPRIAALSRLFFTEFAKKGSAPVYNLLPDIVSSLSSNKSVSPEDFREIIGFLISFLSKERQTETMVEKLCLRFDQSDAVQHHRDVAFCVGALSHTEKSIKKLMELYKTFGSKLGDAEVFGSFEALVLKARKFARAEFKASLDEFSRMLSESAGVAPEPDAEAEAEAEAEAKGEAEGEAEAAPAVEGEAEAAPAPEAAEAEAAEAAEAEEPKKEAKKKEPKAAAKKAKAAPKKGRGKAAVKEEEEEEQEEAPAEAEAEDDENVAPKAKPKSARGAKAKATKAAAAAEPSKERPARSRRAAAA